MPSTPDRRSTASRRAARRPALFFSHVLLALAIAGTPTAADWLVLKDGTRIETRGPWTEETKRVVFTMANGTLSSLPLTEIDLEASHAATAPQPAAAPQPAPPKRKATFVLTDDDVRQYKAPGAEPAVGDEGGEGQASEPASSGGIEIVGWSDSNDPGVDGLLFFGSIRNTGGRPIAGLNLTVHLLDAGGNRRASSQARLNSAALQAGQTTNFRVAFPDEFTYQDLEFEVGSQGSFLVSSDTPTATIAASDQADTGGDSDSAAGGAGQAAGQATSAATGTGAASPTDQGPDEAEDLDDEGSAADDDSDAT